MAKWTCVIVCVHLTAALLSGASAALSAECRVQTIGGVPTLVIDGQPHSGFCYSTYDTSAGNLERRVAEFAQAGCDIYNFVVEISGYGYSRPLWPGKDRWDFTDLDERAHRILAVAPRRGSCRGFTSTRRPGGARNTRRNSWCWTMVPPRFGQHSLRAATGRQFSVPGIVRVASRHAAGPAHHHRSRRTIRLCTTHHRLSVVRAEDGGMVSLEHELRAAG